MLYICTKFHENISKGFRVTELTQFLTSKFSNGHHSVKNVGGVMVLVLCLKPDNALYLYKFHENIYKGVIVIEELVSSFSIFRIFKGAKFI